MSARIHGTNCQCGCRGWNHVDLNREVDVGVFALKRLFGAAVGALGLVADAVQAPHCDCERCRED